MNKKTLTALRGSVKKWEKIVAGTGEDLRTENCPLCVMFYNETSEEFPDNCAGCPVSAKVGRACCEGTPYDDVWIDSLPRGKDGTYQTKAVTPAQIVAAKKELAFLKSLLPRGT